jgi:hypothetical protein
MRIDISNDLSGRIYDIGVNTFQIIKGDVIIDVVVNYDAEIKQEWQDGCLFYAWAENEQYEISADACDEFDKEIEIVWNENLFNN